MGDPQLRHRAKKASRMTRPTRIVATVLAGIGILGGTIWGVMALVQTGHLTVGWYRDLVRDVWRQRHQDWRGPAEGL